MTSGLHKQTLPLVRLTQLLLRGSPCPRGPVCSRTPGRQGAALRPLPALLPAPQRRGDGESLLGDGLWGTRGHPSHVPSLLLEDARRLLEPRAPACMGKSRDFETQRLKLSNLTFHEYFCLLSIFSCLPNQSPLHLWCAFRAAMNFKMCKNDRILTKALIFLFIFMHFIN